MTTIAFANGVLAADSLTSFGEIRGGINTKIAKRGSILAAAAGTTALCQAFMDWFRAGMNGDPPAMKLDDFTAWGVLFYADDGIASLNEAGWERCRTPLWTNGSGGEIALGAMGAGKSPEEAVRIAARFDKSTGGEITVLSRHEPETYSAPVLKFQPRPRSRAEMETLFRGH
jgi:hypothetical protein